MIQYINTTLSNFVPQRYESTVFEVAAIDDSLQWYVDITQALYVRLRILLRTDYSTLCALTLMSYDYV